MTIDTECKEFKERLEIILIEMVCRRYLNAEDVDYSEKQKVSEERLKNIIKKVDFNKLAQETFTGIAKELMAERIIEKGRY